MPSAPQAIGPEARRRRQREEARRSILDASDALLTEGQGDDFSIRELSALCGYSAPTIYHYFGDKDGVIDAVLEERFGRLIEKLHKVELGPDALENVERLALAFVEFGVANPTQFRLVSSVSRKGENRVPPSMEKALDLLRTPLRQLLSQRGRRGTEPEAAELGLWALLHGLANLRNTGPDPRWTPQVMRSAIDAMLRGLVQ